MIYLPYNSKFEPFNHFHPFPPPPPHPVSGNHQSVLCICELGIKLDFELRGKPVMKTSDEKQNKIQDVDYITVCYLICYLALSTVTY